MNPLMIIHIVGGSVALLSGAAALTVRKGGRWHARAGTAFFAAMLILAGTGAAIAALKPERGTAMIGLLTGYLVATAWWAARSRDGRAGRFEQASLAFALGCAAILFALGLIGLNDPRGRVDSLPWQVQFVFGSIAALAAAGDASFLWRGQLGGVQRIGRHLWRMSTAMLIATTSFFQGQRDEFPDALRGLLLWDAIPLVVLAAMLFWIVRVRVSPAYRNWPPRIARRVSADSAPPPRPARSGSPDR